MGGASRFVVPGAAVRQAVPLPAQLAGAVEHLSQGVLPRAPRRLRQPVLLPLAALGIAETADFNGPDGEGAGVYHINTDRGRRASSANAYLRPALASGNVELRTRAHVTRIVFAGRKAVGVEYRHGDQTIQVTPHSDDLNGLTTIRGAFMFAIAKERQYELALMRVMGAGRPAP